MINLTTNDLPKEVLTELKRRRPDEIADNILAIIDSINGEVDIDAVIIAYYRKHQRVFTRLQANTKLKKLVKEERIYQLPNRKAVYAPIDYGLGDDGDENESNADQGVEKPEQPNETPQAETTGPAKKSSKRKPAPKSSTPKG